MNITNHESFKDTALKANEATVEGLQLLIEISELLLAQSMAPISLDSESLIKEIASKEKLAVSLIQESITLQRNLLRRQHDEIENLSNRLI